MKDNDEHLQKKYIEYIPKSANSPIKLYIHSGIRELGRLISRSDPVSTS